jgi:DNA-binding transcriptional MerR regulator
MSSYHWERPEGYLTTTEAARAIGVTFRQLDYWARCGYVAPTGCDRGSGSRRWWAPDDLETAQTVAELMNLRTQPKPILAALQRANSKKERASTNA